MEILKTQNKIWGFWGAASNHIEHKEDTVCVPPQCLFIACPYQKEKDSYCLYLGASGQNAEIN